LNSLSYSYDRELQQTFICDIASEMAVELAGAVPTTVYTTTSTETDVSSFCRICATTGSSNLFSIFSQEDELWDVAEKIGRCLPIIVCMIGRISLSWVYLWLLTAPLILRLSSCFVCN